MRIARIFLDTSMNQGFQGLHRVLLKAKINPENLDPEAYYVFMNSKRTKFKVITGKYLVYFNNGEKQIPLEALQYLPRNFGGSQLEMTDMVRKVVLKQLSSSQAA